MPYVTLVTAANSATGALLTRTLHEHHGVDNVIATDIHDTSQENSGPYQRLDPLSIVQYETIARKYRVRSIFHLGNTQENNIFFGEMDPWNNGVKGLLTLLEFAKAYHVRKICCPFYNSDPLTVEGIASSAGAHWCRYYRHQYQLDVRAPQLCLSWSNEKIVRTILMAMKENSCLETNR
jgi:threonine 3-dehydrogenase